MDVVILGHGGHGRDLEAIALECGNFTTYLDDNGTDLPTSERLAPGEVYVVGVWEPHAREALDRPDDDAATLIHPSARVGPNFTGAEGVVIGAGAMIGPDVTLGRHVHIGANATLTRCTVGEFTTISNGAVICGDVTIGSRVLVGANATVKNLLTIGDDAVLGSGANVCSNVMYGMTYLSPKAVAS